MSELCKCPQLMAGTTTVRSGWSAECPVHKSTDPIASFTAHPYVQHPTPRSARIPALAAEVERLRAALSRIEDASSPGNCGNRGLRWISEHASETLASAPPAPAAQGEKT